MATPSGSSIAPSSSVIESGMGNRHFSSQAMNSRNAPSVPPCPAKMTVGHRLGCPRRQNSQVPHGIAGSTATRSPDSVTAANSCPSTSGLSSLASPMPCSENQCKSEPQMPTEVTRSSRSPGRGRGCGSSCKRKSCCPCKRKTFISKNSLACHSRRTHLRPPQVRCRDDVRAAAKQSPE